MGNQFDQQGKREKEYRILSIILGILVAVFLVLSGVLFLLGRSGRIKPAANIAAQEWETFYDGETDVQDVTSTPGGFTVQR